MRWGAISAAIAVGAVGCATILGIDDGTARPPPSDCPQYDLTRDPAHCGACDTACNPGEVCSLSACKAQCDAPAVRCASGDAGAAVCANTQTDPAHCGTCTGACGTADAGSLKPGTGNPDSGVPYDGGPGWSVGNPSCAGGKCGLSCPVGQTQCSDGICYDTANFHDRCGSCASGCMPQEWCALGHCCPGGHMFCGGACIDVLNDSANCGGCGVACSGATPACANGKCAAACTPSGMRQAFNTLAMSPTGACVAGDPCPQDAYVLLAANIASFTAVGQTLACSATSPACIAHVGITTYSTTQCQGAWDVYCDAKKVGTIDTVGKATCTGSAMTSGCSTTFTPVDCAEIKLVSIAGMGAACCGSGAVDSRVTSISAW